jgi:APA family basic amino acid/polyamine antiporter
VNRGGTPSTALILTAITGIALALTGEFETVFRIMATLGMFPLLLADLALFKLRRDAPDLPRPYRAKLYPWLPGLAVFLDVTVLAAFLLSDWTSGLFILAAVALAWPLGSWMARSRRGEAG